VKREAAEATKLSMLVCLPEQQPSPAGCSDEVPYLAEGKDNDVERKLTFLHTFLPTR
jgi:hypothetical protein